MFSVSIIGSGKLAWQLAPALEKAGYPIEEIWSRNLLNAQKLAERLSAAKSQTGLDFRNSKSAFFIISISDGGVKDLVSQLHLPSEAVLVHTAGSLPKEILEPSASSYGILYPLQTFSKDREVDWSELPFGLEASDPETYGKIQELARSLSRNVRHIDFDKRKHLHLAAVFACNFTNHLLRISHTMLREIDMEPSILQPLIRETVEKSLLIGPENAQTGPAVRKNFEIMEDHLQLLFQHSQWAKLYKQISEDIMKHSFNEN